MTAFLADSSLAPLWAVVRAALDRNGVQWRGRLMLPSAPPLAPEGRRRLGIVLDCPIPPGRRAVSLDALAAGVEAMTGRPLLDVLADLGYAPTGRREAAVLARESALERRAALDAALASRSSSAPWALAWAERAWRDGLFSGLSASDVAALVARVFAVLGSGGAGRSRTEVAAAALGDAHALDSSTSLSRLVTRALVERDGPGEERAVWERAGVPLDLVSAPALAWALPLTGDDAVAVASRTMTAAGLPLHLSTMAVRAAAVRVPRGVPVLVVENPRLVEGAAQRRLGAAVLCTGGNPTTAPIELMRSLHAAGAVLRYHGDFDGPGLAMTARALSLGCVPFGMSAADYVAAVDAAVEAGVELPRDASSVPPTPWDDSLAEVFARRRAIVHEERVMDDVLAAHAGSARTGEA